MQRTAAGSGECDGIPSHSEKGDFRVPCDCGCATVPMPQLLRQSAQADQLPLCDNSHLPWTIPSVTLSVETSSARESRHIQGFVWGMHKP